MNLILNQTTYMDKEPKTIVLSQQTGYIKLQVRSLENAYTCQMNIYPPHHTKMNLKNRKNHSLINYMSVHQIIIHTHLEPWYRPMLIMLGGA